MRRRKLLTALMLMLLLLATFALFRQPDTRPGMITMLISRIAHEWPRW
jgi:hypothetical protein